MIQLFELASKLHGSTAPFEYLPGTDGEAYVLGEALALSGGKLTKCGATAVPEFICQKTVTASTPANARIPVMRVTAEQEFETKFAAAPTGINAGNAVTIHTDGLFVTATTEGGVFKVSKMLGTAQDSRVRGYFK